MLMLLSLGDSLLQTRVAASYMDKDWTENNLGSSTIRAGEKGVLCIQVLSIW